VIEVRAEAELPAGLSDVWAVVGDWTGLIRLMAKYLPVPVTVAATGTGPGAIRTIRVGDQTIIEKQQYRDEPSHTYSYAIVEGPHPVTDYLATVQVVGLDETRSRVIWTGRFHAAAGAAAGAAAEFRELYDRTLQMLTSHFAG
jgi:hypothetical protein